MLRSALYAFMFALVAAPRVPAPNDVADALMRAYGGAVAPQTSRTPAFVTGDFNWDGSEDLAVAVVPVEGKLDAINSDVANWLLVDPAKVRIPDFLPRRVGPAPSTRTVVRKDDTLLAIIQGDGSEGWRSRRASHFQLLADRGGASLSRWSQNDFYAAIRNSPSRVRSVRGDVIGETRSGVRGFLVYAGGKYAWYDPAISR